MNSLPDSCITKNMDGDTIMIKNGEVGYYKLPAGLVDPHDFNRRRGADERVISIMTSASMFGWDIPVVKNYEPEVK